MGIGKSVPDRCLAKIRDGEPYFVLRAQDKLAPGRVRDWLALAHPTLTPEHAAEAHALLYAMEQWQRDNPELVKEPD